MIDNKDTPAFPTITWEQLNNGTFVQVTESAGLTKREYFAGLAMQGLLSCIEMQRWLQTDPRYTGQNFAKVVAINATEFADALIEQLSKP
jgi:hypothetical protein